MILLIGANGSMGTRHRAILDYLHIDYSSTDVEETEREVLGLASRSDGIIVATPTHMHMSYLEKLAPFGKPVLCEKPLSKNKEDFQKIKDLVKGGLNLTTMMQYRELDWGRNNWSSHYDYFRHGNDGLIWDCFQIIALARGSCELREKSPIWDCVLNGHVLHLSQMDKAYVEFVKNWLKKPGDDIHRIIDMHLKVSEFKNA